MSNKTVIDQYVDFIASQDRYGFLNETKQSNLAQDLSGLQKWGQGSDPGRGMSTSTWERNDSGTHVNFGDIKKAVGNYLKGNRNAVSEKDNKTIADLHNLPTQVWHPDDYKLIDIKPEDKDDVNHDRQYVHVKHLNKILNGSLNEK